MKKSVFFLLFFRLFQENVDDDRLDHHFAKLKSIETNHKKAKIDSSLMSLFSIPN